MRDNELYEFGPFRIDVALSRLERAGRPIPLPPKAFDLLVLLTRNTDRVMTKIELMEALWPNTFVEEANLTQHVYTLRKALGEQANGVPYIDTVPRRGYRLAATVRSVTADRAADPVSVDPVSAAQALRPADDLQNDGAAVTSETSAAASRAERQALTGERKHATVLDCRVAEAGDVIERAGPAALPDLVGNLMTVSADEIGKYEGVITERHSDGFVALFGAPVVHEDDARRAVLAALAIQRRFPSVVPSELAAEKPVALRFGISTGSMVVTGVTERGGYSALGDAARTADLLQQMAEPGSVLIAETTRRAVHGFIDVASTAVQIAGTRAFRVVGQTCSSAVRLTRFARTLSQFVGRHLHLSTLDNLAHHVRDGRGQAVSIVGEPGIGKSRVVHEFTQQVALPSGMTVLEARCVSYGSLVPYLPLADLIRAHCGVSDSDAPEAIRAAIDRMVRDHDLPADTGTWLLRLIGMVDAATALAALSPEAIKARTFDALRTLFFKASIRMPLVLVVEDVHWIDRTSEEFLTTLVGRLTAARIMVLTTHRPGYRVPWLDRSYLTQITLTPLTSADSAQLVDSVAKDRPLPEVVAAAILKKGEGNPFFLEELARAVIDRGPVLSAVDTPESQSIPDTVHGVIMARLDRLPESAKRVLQAAAVLGREVPLHLLDRMQQGEPHRAELAELCRLEFLYERTASDEPVLVFKHALTQDVAYDSLLVRTRRELHLRAAEALVALYGETRDDLAAAFAYHYARTDLIDEAVRWLTRAAEQAARVYANAEAILHLDLAARRLQRLPEGPERDRRMIEVALRHAHSLYFLGRFPSSVEVLLPHEARLARLDDPALTAAYAFWLAHMHSRLGDQRRACDNAARAIEAATRAKDEQTLGKAHGLLALEGHWSGNTADGIAHGKKAVRLLRDHPNQRWWLGMAHFYLAMNHLLKGDFEPALEAARRSDEVGKEIADPRLQTYAGFTAAWVEVTRGNPDAAVELARRGRDLAPDRVSRAYASMILGFALLERGNHAEARALLEPIVAELESFGFPQWQGFATALAAESYRLDREFDRARSLAERAIDVTTRAKYWYGVGFAQRVIGRIARDSGTRDEAAAALSNAALTFDRVGACFEAQRTRRELSALDSGAGIRD